MGIFKDLRTLRKQAKELQKQAKDMGAPVGIRETLAWSVNEAMPLAQEVLSQQAGQAELLEHGLEGTARIVGLVDMSASVNEMPVVQFDLDVTAGGFGPYRTTHRQIVSRVRLVNLAIGKTVPVRVDREDRSKLFVLPPE
jgi:hypothetical protein